MLSYSARKTGTRSKYRLPEKKKGEIEIPPESENGEEQITPEDNRSRAQVPTIGRGRRRSNRNQSQENLEKHPGTIFLNLYVRELR